MRDFQPAFRTVLFFIVSVTATSCGRGEQAPNTAAQNSGVEDAAIRAQLAANFAAGNKHDASGVVATYATDGDLMIGAGPRIAGRDAVRHWLEAAWSTAPSDRQGNLTVDSIRLLAADVAIVDSTARWTAGEPLQDRATWIMVRRDRTWHISAVRILPAQQQ
jgi:uncharacterized protein (TIGR02246 family)